MGSGKKRKRKKIATHKRKSASGRTAIRSAFASRRGRDGGVASRRVSWARRTGPGVAGSSILRAGGGEAGANWCGTDPWRPRTATIASPRFRTKVPRTWSKCWSGRTGRSGTTGPVASQFRLRLRFPDQVEREAGQFAEPGARGARRPPRSARPPGLHHRPGGRSRPRRCAVRVPLAHGRHEVGIHIADVSHYVRPGSALDREARLRGPSAYLPGGALPMLPARLSSDCAPAPDRTGLALSVLVDLDGASASTAARFSESVIRSRHRLHYEQVQEILEGRRPVARIWGVRSRGCARWLRRSDSAGSRRALSTWMCPR